MSDFFKGWRRKVGCAALVMASVLTVGWMRSLYVFDGFTNPARMRMRAIFSVEQSIISEWADNLEHQWWAPTFSSSPALNNSFLGNELIQWSFVAFGFRIGEVPADRFPYPVWYVVVPYYALVLPLVLLSAFLLLSKPRPTA